MKNSLVNLLIMFTVYLVVESHNFEYQVFVMNLYSCVIFIVGVALIMKSALIYCRNVLWVRAYKEVLSGYSTGTLVLLILLIPLRYTFYAYLYSNGYVYTSMMSIVAYTIYLPLFINYIIERLRGEV